MVLIEEPELQYQLNVLVGPMMRAHVPAIEHRGPGELQENIVNALESEGLRVDPQIVTLFTWSSGYQRKYRGDPWMTPNGVQFMRFPEVIPAYHEWVLEPTETAQPGWLPIMRLLEGWILLNCSPEESNPGQVRVFIDGETFPPVQDLATVISWWRERFEDGRWRYSPPGDEPSGWIVAEEDLLAAPSLAYLV